MGLLVGPIGGSARRVPGLREPPVPTAAWAADGCWHAISAMSLRACPARTAARPGLVFTSPAWTSAPRPVVRRMRSRRVRRLAASSGCGGGVGMVGADGRSGRGAHRRAVDAAPRRAPAGRWRPLLMLAAATPQRSFVVAAVRFSHGGLLAVVRRCLGCDRCVCFARSIVSREGMPEPWPHRTAAATDGGAARRGADVEPEGCPFGASSERRLAAKPGPAPMGCPQVSPAWSPSPGDASGDVVLCGLRVSRVPAGARSRSGSAKRSRGVAATGVAPRRYLEASHRRSVPQRA